jgi:hypothetical protein
MSSNQATSVTDGRCHGVFRTKIYNDPYIFCDQCGTMLPWNDPDAVAAGGDHKFMPNVPIKQQES